jgi:hypothetical protein
LVGERRTAMADARLIPANLVTLAFKLNLMLEPRKGDTHEH